MEPKPELLGELFLGYDFLGDEGATNTSNATLIATECREAGDQGMAGLLDECIEVLFAITKGRSSVVECVDFELECVPVWSGVRL